MASSVSARRVEVMFGGAIKGKDYLQRTETMDANEFFDWFLNWRQAITHGIIDCSNQELSIPIEAQALLSQALGIVEKAAENKELNSDAK